MHVHIDPVGGLSGGMLIAALIDARPDLRDGALAAMQRGTGSMVGSLSVGPYRGTGFIGHRFVAEGGEVPAAARNWRGLRATIARAGLEPPVERRTAAVFRLLAEAGAAVQGVEPDDAVLDPDDCSQGLAAVVGVAFVLEALRISRCSVATLPLGSGRIVSGNGVQPVPGPVTAKLLQGFAVVDDGVPGERVTRVGAAILRFLSPMPSLPTQDLRMAGNGYGFGTATLAGIPNLLRVLLFDDGAPNAIQPPISLAAVQFEVDDQPPHDLAIGLDNLRRHDGVLDVLQMAAFGRYGRMVFTIRLLCRMPVLERVLEACLIETSATAVRWSVMHQADLPRVERCRHGDRLGVVLRPGGVRSATITTETFEDGCGYLGRRDLRRAAEAQILRENAGEGTVGV